MTDKHTRNTLTKEYIAKKLAHNYMVNTYMSLLLLFISCIFLIIGLAVLSSDNLTAGEISFAVIFIFPFVFVVAILCRYIIHILMIKKGKFVVTCADMTKKMKSESAEDL